MVDSLGRTELLRMTEVKRTLGCSRSQAYALAASGVIPSIKVGRSVRVPYKALMRWIEQHTVGGEAKQ